jgi:hypothetical protein
MRVGLDLYGKHAPLAVRSSTVSQGAAKKVRAVRRQTHQPASHRCRPARDGWLAALPLARDALRCTAV